MTDKLVWDYDQSSGEHHAIVKRNYQTYRIRAVLDQMPSNPFLDGDMNWPIVVRSPDSRHDLHTYLFGEESNGSKFDMDMFSDTALIHNQIHIAKLLKWRVGEAIEAYCTGLEEEWSDRKYCNDPGLLRDAFEQVVADQDMSRQLEIHEELFKLAGWPTYRTVTGYSQGDWAEVLVVATPEAVEKFGTDIEHFRTEAKAMPEIRTIDPARWPEWIEDKAAELMLATTAKLYGWWAFGDVYGHIVERRCVGESFDDDDGTDEEWEELPDGSCWGYYGPDHDQSGLEESALGCIPDETSMQEAA